MIRIDNLKKHFRARSQRGYVIKAVDGVNLCINEGEIFGIVGESGCGKTTLARLILRLIEPTQGKIFIDERDILNMNPLEFKRMRQKYQIIWQHPQESLNPRMKIRDSILEPLRYYTRCRYVNPVRNKISNGVNEAETLLKYCELVGLRDEVLDRYPHELSGGENQRAVIARILTMQPELIIADEPTSALDVSVQAQILNLLKNIQKEFKITCIFISHNLEIVRYMCKRMAVMFKGKIIEEGPVEEIFTSAKSNYARELISNTF